MIPHRNKNTLHAITWHAATCRDMAWHVTACNYNTRQHATPRDIPSHVVTSYDITKQIRPHYTA
eukprot:9145365-Lingulodinium_polyedra.AAC.1